MRTVSRQVKPLLGKIRRPEVHESLRRPSSSTLRTRTSSRAECRGAPAGRRGLTGSHSELLPSPSRRGSGQRASRGSGLGEDGFIVKAWFQQGGMLLKRRNATARPSVCRVDNEIPKTRGVPTACASNRTSRAGNVFITAFVDERSVAGAAYADQIGNLASSTMGVSLRDFEVYTSKCYPAVRRMRCGTLAGTWNARSSCTTREKGLLFNHHQHRKGVWQDEHRRLDLPIGFRTRARSTLQRRSSR